jgi:hypothetical protein
MGNPKESICTSGFCENARLLAAFICLMVVQLAAGCAGSVSSERRSTQPAQLAISSASIPSAKVQTAYSATLSATGGTTPYTWSLASGALPLGLNLSSSGGQIMGTPSQAGNSTFTVQVTDSSTPAQTAKAQFSIMVVTPVIALQITSNSLPAGQEGTAYSNTLAASGGTAPYSWSINSGALPAGVTLSSAGTISGTPTASGSFNFTVKVTDSTTPAAQTATQPLALSIVAVAFSASLSWTASTSSDVTGYNIYRSTLSGGSYTKINSSLVPGLTYTDSSVASGQTYYYLTTSVDSTGGESLNSNQVQAVIP